MADEYTSAQTLAPAATHWPPYDPGPAIEQAREDAARALHSVATFGSPALMRAMGYEPPEWMQALERASQNPEVNAALGVLSGPIGRMRSARSALESDTGQYPPPTKPLRPFTADYPTQPRTDSHGRLTHDIEGRPLNPWATVVGRRMVGAEDTAISPAELDALTEAAIGTPPLGVTPKELGPLTAAVYNKPLTADRPTILFNKGLGPEDAFATTQHEAGHMINDLAGKQVPLAGTKFGLIPSTEKMNPELETVYNDLNNPHIVMHRELTKGEPSPEQYKFMPRLTGVTPELMMYEPQHVPHEYMAEAVRAYLADPNYMKTVAPHTAAAIRKAVNENPKLAQWIQFNAVLPPIGPSEKRQGDNVPGEAKQSGLMERWEKAFNEAGEHPRMPWEPTPDPEELERTRKVATGVVTGLPVGGFLGVAAKKLSPMLGPLTMGGVGAGLGGTLGASYQHKPKTKGGKDNPATQEQVRTLRQKIIDQMKRFRNEAPEE